MVFIWISKFKYCLHFEKVVLLCSGLQVEQPLRLHGTHLPRRENKFLREASWRISEDGGHGNQGRQQVYPWCRLLKSFYPLDSESISQLGCKPVYSNSVFLFFSFKDVLYSYCNLLRLKYSIWLIIIVQTKFNKSIVTS